MKKFLALFVVCGLLVGIAGVYSADAAAKKKMVKKKVTKKAVKKAAPKAAPAPVAPVPPPPPAAVPLPPPPVVKAPAPAGGLLGLGLNSDISAGYLMGKSVVSGRADLILDDPLGLGALVGLGAKAVNYRVGLGVATGNDINNDNIQAFPLFIEGILNLPADLMGGINSYVAGGVNYTLYGTDKTSGTYGIQALAGVSGDIGLGGKSFVEVGYSVIRAGQTAKRSAKGISVSVGQQLVL